MTGLEHILSEVGKMVYPETELHEIFYATQAAAVKTYIKTLYANSHGDMDFVFFCLDQ